MRNILSNKEVVTTVRSRVLSLLRRRVSWQGTMTDLLRAISTRRVPEVWPGSPSSLRRIVNQVIPALRREGFEVEFTRTTDHERRRMVSFKRVR